ncbi:conserved Plasmodium protein, unknown function [Plasmodium knowlesi strain H]|uniref:Replication factor A protein 3 n=3 Tax=Plasmodium knowlesi TaxID=5850 RepID=A0A5K1U332_PLAKH|nr:conserved Plasmodium protein, unknown function [Plasmodium knowlesi strain H]OTN68696.1 Uncharacterized protein PKNOH_S01016400 [Plasmodium knowlesi]CAA9986161.1 conserved Plasmodium protein, unknown function [Plasmodium knowlesi strain H]SBO25351.1 conserved Plasmodium protein, unknown function [Plasmodium knowlesi strain H]SBO27656.1 conserved Plasmodium protein, unknown function [Plasmodium knowlesi strain H]VVS75635.1 conserved Plasmodium protein, unknown function [Plasmodium knowlesi s|eukprot:XP_002257572.1 hypothetical protein, conserved in Plasmodium species [Plasmodium knowlesi strain H]
MMNDIDNLEHITHDDGIYDEKNFNAYDRFDQDKDDEMLRQRKVGMLISEKYLSDFINQDIFFIGEIVDKRDKLISLKSVNGNCVDCIIRDKLINEDAKYIGIKGTVSDDLKIIETRGIIYLDDVNFEVVNEYVDIFMENANSEVFLSSY